MGNEINKGCALDTNPYMTNIGVDGCTSDLEKLCGIVPGSINETKDATESQQQCLKKLKDGKFINICFCSSDYCNAGTFLKSSVFITITGSTLLKLLLL